MLARENAAVLYLRYSAATGKYEEKNGASEYSTILRTASSNWSQSMSHDGGRWKAHGDDENLVLYGMRCLEGTGRR